MNLITELPSAKVLLQPTRLDVLRHLVICGGSSSLSETRKAIGDPCQQLLSEHCSKLELAGFIERHRHFVGNVAATELVLTSKARRALELLGREVAS